MHLYKPVLFQPLYRMYGVELKKVKKAEFIAFENKELNP